MTTKTQVFFIPFTISGQNTTLGMANQRYGKTNAYAIYKRKIEHDIMAVIKASKLKPVEAAEIHFVWHEKTARRDPDNIVSGKKFIIDALVKAQVLPEDGWKQVKGFGCERWIVNKENPGVSVSIIPWKGETHE